MQCLCPALSWPFLSTFYSSFLCANNKRSVKISNNKLANMSAAAGARPDVAGSLAFPRVRAAACWPHSLHGTGRCLDGSRVGGGVSLSTIWASKTNKLQTLLHQEVAMVPVDTWKCRNSSLSFSAKSCLLSLKVGGESRLVLFDILLADLLESESVT